MSQTTSNVNNDFRKGLYWGNFPTKPVNNLGFFEEEMHKMFIKNVTYPYVIFTDHNRIDFRDITDNIKTVKKLRKGNETLHVFLFEPICHYINNKQYTNSYFSEFDNTLNDVVRSEELDSIVKFQEDTGIKVRVHTCDYGVVSFFKDRYPTLNLTCDDLFLKWIGLPIRHVDTDKTFKKKFWCANGRYSVHRHIVTAYLADKPGNYSWYFKAHFTQQIKDLDWIGNLPWNKLEANNNLLNTGDYKIDNSINIQDINNHSACYVPILPPTGTDLFLQTYRDSFCAIINETRYAQPTGNISEKVLNAIAMRTPFVLVAPPKSLEYVKALGFKTFNKWWDESYDNELDHTQRLIKIFNIIDKINNMSDTEIKEMYNDMQKVLKHNHKVLTAFSTSVKEIDL